MTQTHHERAPYFRRIDRAEALRERKNRKIARICERASEAFERGDCQRGMSIFSRAAARDPERSATICAAEIRELVRAHQKDHARRVFEKRASAGRVSPQMANGILEAYQHLAGPESYAKALRLVDRIEESGLSLFCLSQKSLELVIRVLYDRKKFGRIEGLLGKASKFGALSEKLQLELLEAKRKLGKYAEVIDAVDNFLDGKEVNFGNAAYLLARVIRAYALNDGGGLLEALAEFDVLMGEVPEDSPSRCRVVCGWIFTKKEFGDFIEEGQQDRVRKELMKYAGGSNKERAKKARKALRDLLELDIIEIVQVSIEPDEAVGM